MGRWPIKKKFQVCFVLLALLLSVGIGLMTYLVNANQVKKSYLLRTTECAQMAMTMINGDAIPSYLSHSNTDDFNETVSRLQSLKKTFNLTFVSVCIPQTDALLCVFDVKTADDNPDLFYAHGDLIGNAPGFDYYKQVFSSGVATEKPIIGASRDATDVSSVFLPIFNSNKSVVAVLRVDMAMDNALSDVTMLTLLMTLVSVGFVGLLAFVFLYILNKQIASPIAMITNRMRDFAASDSEMDYEPVTVVSSDEIRVMADSLNCMVDKVLSYVNDAENVAVNEERIRTELSMGSRIQQSLLPTKYPAFPERFEFDIYATMEPAKEVGGDFYDFFLIDQDHLAIVMADVSGKGVPAALIMVISKTLLNSLLKQGGDPKDVLYEVNNELCIGNEGDLFLTAFIGVWEISTGNFTYANAGHDQPLLKHKDGDFEWLDSDVGFILAGMKNVKYKSRTVKLEAGDFLYLYTDGVPEAQNVRGSLYSGARLKERLNELKVDRLSLREILEGVKSDVDNFVGDNEQFDDLTMMILQIKE